MDKEQMAAVRKADRLVSQLRAAVSPVATLNLAHTFLTVAQHEGKSLTELAVLLNQSVPTTSRNILDLGERNRKKEEGYKLVKAVQNPMNLRENMYSLTPKGRLLIDQILRILED